MTQEMSYSQAAPNTKMRSGTAHDDVIKWKKKSVLLALCAGNWTITGVLPSRRPGLFLTSSQLQRSFQRKLRSHWLKFLRQRHVAVIRQGPVTRSFDVFYDLRPANGWANNRDAGDLRRHSDHYNVTVMFIFVLSLKCQYDVNRMSLTMHLIRFSKRIFI